ncbi:MAG: hypothetical protein WCP53_03850 [Verrucomicrobiota bacterium]
MSTPWNSARAVGFQRGALGIALWITLTGIGFLRVFNGFSDYDDEGYVLLTIKHFVAGHPLYDDVYTQYGPCFYWFASALTGFGRWAVTHDWGRLITLGCWLVSTALGSCWVADRTKSKAWAAMAAVLLFANLQAMLNEPMHPQTVCIVLVFALVTVASRGPLIPRRRLALGALAAVLALVKINLGAFAFLGLAWLEVLVLPRDLWRRGLLAGLTAASFLLPLLLFRPLLGLVSVRCYAAVFCLGMVPLVVFLWQARPAEGARLSWTDGWWLGLGAAMTTAIVIGWTLVHGSTLAALWDTLVTRNSSFAKNFQSFDAFDRYEVWVTMFSLGGFLLFQSWQRQGKAVQALRFLLVLRLTIGGIVLLAALINLVPHLTGYLRAWLIFTYSFSKWGFPFLWLGLPWTGRENQGAAGPLSAAVLLGFPQLLWAFPVAGTQVAMAAAMPLVVSLVYLHQAVTALRWPRWVAPDRWATVITLMALLGGLAGSYRYYVRSTPLCLPGSDWVRLPDEGNAARLAWASHNLRRYSTTFVTRPGVASLHLWSGVEPPTRRNSNFWMSLLTPQEQQEIVAAMTVRDGVLVLVNDLFLKFSGQAEYITNSVSARFILDHFTPAIRVGAWTLLQRPTDVEHRWIHQAWMTSPAQGQLPRLRLRFGSDEPRDIGRVTVFDVTNRRVLEDAIPVPVPGGVAPADGVWELELPMGTDLLPDPEHAVVARLWNRQGRRIGTVPVIPPPTARPFGSNDR